MHWNTITWWGIAGIEIHLEGLHLGFDPYLQPHDNDLHYIFITHEHYDHLNEETLRSLTHNPRFKMLVASKPCFFASRLNSATTEHPTPSDLAWVDRDRVMVFYPHIAPGNVRYDGPSEVRMGRVHVLGVESGEAPLEWADHSPLEEPFPTVGYVVTDQLTGLSFYHPGDITNAFDELAQLAGEVTHLFLPIGKLGGAEARMVELIRPQYLVPIHYRLETVDWPIPLTVSQQDVQYASWHTGHPVPGVTDHDARYWHDISKMIQGGWYPTVPDPEGFIKALKAEIGTAVEILVLQPGRAYTLDVRTGMIEGADTVR